MPATVVAVPAEHGGVGLRGDQRGGRGGVVVAADVDVGDAELPDRADQLVLRCAAPVGDVAGVEDAVDLELVHDLAHQVEPGGVQVQVGHVQQGDGLVGAAGRRAARRSSSTGCRRSRRGPPARRGRRRSGRRCPRRSPIRLFALTSRPVYVGCESASGRQVAAPRPAVPSQHDRGDGGGDRRFPAAAQHDQRGEGGPGDRDRRPSSRPGCTTARAQVVAHLVHDAGQPDGVGRERLGAVLVDPLERDVQSQRAVVDVHVQRAERRDGDGRAAAGRPERQRGVERADGGGDPAEQQHGDHGAGQGDHHAQGPATGHPGPARPRGRRGGGRVAAGDPGLARLAHPHHATERRADLVGRKIQRRATKRIRPMAAVTAATRVICRTDVRRADRGVQPAERGAGRQQAHEGDAAGLDLGGEPGDPLLGAEGEPAVQLVGQDRRGDRRDQVGGR